MDNIDKVLSVVAVVTFIGALYFIVWSNVNMEEKVCHYQYHAHRKPTLICE